MDDDIMNTRMALVEDRVSRLQTAADELEQRIATVEACTSGIPRIEKALDDVLQQLKFLNECKIAAEATAKAKISWLESPGGKLVWDLARALIIGGIGWLALVNQHLVLAGGK